MNNQVDDEIMTRRVRLLRLYLNDELDTLSYGDIAQRFHTNEFQIAKDMQWVELQDTDSIMRHWMTWFNYDSELILSL